MGTETELVTRIEGLLRQLFVDLQDAVDAEVVSYLSAGLAEDDEPDTDELSDTLAGFSPSFGSLGPSKQRQLVEDLLRRVAGLKQEERQPPAAAAAPTTASQAAPSLARVAAEALSRLSSLSVSSAASSECGGDGGSGSDDQPPLSAAQQQAVAGLRELCALPHISDAFLAHVLLSKGGGDAEAAAVWMLECSDLGAAQEAWHAVQQRQQEERRRAAQEREAAKKEIVNRFHLQAVPNGVPAKGKPAQLKAWGAGDGSEGRSKARYRDGVVVSSRGEKYIIEKPEEFDGGSRGKVYTKGKRGKGYV